MVVIRGRLTPEAGAVLRQALDAARETLYQRARGTDAAESPEDVPAETPSMAQQQADALALLAETALHHGIDPGAPGDRYQVVVHVDASVLADPEAPGQSVLEGGTHVSAETSRRLACDASRVVMRHDPDGRIDRNPYGVRVAVALSVDGLNTIDARETTAAAARKWVIGPYETIVISGWQTSQTEARRFEFTTEDKSYGQALGKTANLGMISAVFFKERVVTYMPETSKDRDRRQSAPSAPAPAKGRLPGGAREESRAEDEYAATGMGRRTGHAVEQVWLNLEESPVARGEHPLRIPSAARQARRPAAGSDRRSTVAA